MSFTIQLINREVFPTKHILVCEDVIAQQLRIIDKLAGLFFELNGKVQLSIVPGAIMAASIILNTPTDLIVLDNDMPYGSGSELIVWMKENKKDIPIITFSGLEVNNERLMTLGATYRSNKERVINGTEDDLIKSILGIEGLLV